MIDEIRINLYDALRERPKISLFHKIHSKIRDDYDHSFALKVILDNKCEGKRVLVKRDLDGLRSWLQSTCNDEGLVVEVIAE